MKRFLRPVALSFICVLALIISTSRASSEEARQKMIYFFENYCETCHPEEEFRDTFHALTGHSVDEYDYVWYNVRFQANRELFDEAAGKHGITPENRHLPMVIVGDRVYTGSARLESEMPFDFLENESMDSVIWLLYSPACDGCTKAEATIDALPESVTIRRGAVELESKTIVHRVNIYEEPSLARALYQRYAVPEDMQTTPIVFIGEDYLRGADAIGERLIFKLRAGRAIGTPLVSSESAAPYSSFSLAGTAAAGLIAGFNPCALSMLLLFISLILTAKTNALRYVALFLTAKLTTYILAGTVFLSVFNALNLSWLPVCSKIVLTLIGGVLIALNVLDAHSARQERYGSIKNQLPQTIRRFLNDRIHRTAASGRRLTSASVALLGIIVAGGEFLCSGQLYLASLTASLSSGTAYIHQFVLLIVFCLAFLFPSIGITVILFRSKSIFAVSNKLLTHMPLIKLLTSAAMFCIILAAWFLPG